MHGKSRKWRSKDDGSVKSPNVLNPIFYQSICFG